MPASTRLYRTAGRRSEIDCSLAIANGGWLEWSTVYVIDAAAGEEIPRKGGPGITRSDLLAIDKTDLAPMVGASLQVMEADTRRMRGEWPFDFSNLRTGAGVPAIRDFIVRAGMLAAA